jgi:uncharacterized protein (DUF1919 family)
MKYEAITFKDLHIDEMRQNRFIINLHQLREKIIEQGMTLLSDDEVLEEVAKRRSGFNFSWEGGLSSDKSSVDIQHEIRQ